MNVCLDNRKKIYLTNDPYQLILRKKTKNIDKNGNPVYSNLSYHANFSQVAQALYKLKINESNAETIEQLGKDHKQAVQEVMETFNTEGMVE